jgi:hypothetical protein
MRERKMRYSLFIDESGDFQHSKEWIVSGILCPFDKDTAEKYLKKTLGHLPQRLGVSSFKKLHLTELRKERGHDAAVEIADSIFSALHNSQYKWKLVVCRNQSKFGLSNPERTYRLMLLDLIALAESIMPEGIKLSGFDVVIATRTDNTGERMTTLVDLNHDVVTRISDALEAGIASRGMIDFMDSKGLEITLLQANKSWGLITADFICNISYNHNYSSESVLLNKIKRVGILSEFQSFGGYQERRARIAERDGNFIDAIRRWAIIEYKNDKEKKQQLDILKRLFDRIVSFGTAGPQSTLDAIIEHIWRDKTLRGKFDEIYNISARLEVVLDRCSKNDPSSQVIPLLFRIQNFMHLVANKAGDTQKAQQLILKKKQHKSQIAVSPESFPLMLDSQLYEIDTIENALLLSDCFALAQSHHDLVQLYKECWELLVGDHPAQGFNASRLNLKSEMTLLRSQILVSREEELESALTRISRLKKIPLNSDDKKRLLSYEMLTYIKCKEYGRAISIGMDEVKSSQDRFIVQHLLQATVSGLLSNKEKYQKVGVQLLSFMEQYSMPEAGHPVELIWRDWGMLDFLVTGKKNVVLRYLKRSKKHLAQMPKSTAVVQWLHVLLDLHLEIVKGLPTTNKSIEELSQLITRVQLSSLSSVEKLPEDSRELLTLCRHASPY